MGHAIAAVRARSLLKRGLVATAIKEKGGLASAAENNTTSLDNEILRKGTHGGTICSLAQNLINATFLTCAKKSKSQESASGRPKPMWSTVFGPRCEFVSRLYDAYQAQLDSGEDTWTEQIQKFSGFNLLPVFPAAVRVRMQKSEL